MMPDDWEARPKQVRGRIDPGSPAGAPVVVPIIGRNKGGQQGHAAPGCRTSSLIGIKQWPGDRSYDWIIQTSSGMIEVSDFGNKDSGSPLRRRTGLDAVSAVKMPEGLTSAVDAWAEAHHLTRSDAICKLVEMGLRVAPAASAAPHTATASDATRLEEIAVHEIDRLLDPALPPRERERRIRRLTEGPPEFSHERIDLPKHEP